MRILHRIRGLFSFKTYDAAIDAAVEETRRTGEMAEKRIMDGAVAYAYEHPLGVAWGVNGAYTGHCILRGIRKPDGTDEAAL